jgi:hypothetical protein
VFGRFLDPVVLNLCSSISSPGTVAKDMVQLTLAKALKIGVRSTPHTAPQPLPTVDLVAEAAKLQEAMARGAQAAQQARAQEEEGDVSRSGAGAAAQADYAEETGRGDADGAAQAVIEVEAGQGDAASAARPDTGGETGGGVQERPADNVEAETLVLEPPRAEVECIAGGRRR